MASSPISAPNRKELHPPKILLVDDIEENLALLEDVFRENGYESVLARNGVEALQLLRTEAVSLIVADAMMPRMDGFQLCREVKSDPALAKVPFIIYTANYINDEDRAFARSIGVDKYVVKYQGLAALLEAVDELSRKGCPAPDQAAQYSTPTLDHIENSTEHVRRRLQHSGQIEGEKDSSIIVDDLGFLEKHHAVVVRKLEEKMQELEMFAETLARRNRELQASEARYRSFFEHASIAIFVLDRVSGKVLDVNKEGVKLLGFSKAELLEMAHLPFLDQNGFTTAVLETKNSFTKETVMKCKDGTTINVDVDVRPIDQSQDTRIMLYVRDVTEKKKMREQLQQAEKVAFMGRLAAGIAHEIRNPLSAVTVSLQYLVQKYGVEFIDRDSLETALEGARRIEQVIENTLSLARPTPPLLAEEQINDVVNRSLWFLKIPLQQKGVKVHTQLAENLPSITIDAKQIQQVILNLVQNAIDASSPGSVITVSTGLAGGVGDAWLPSHTHYGGWDASPVRNGQDLPVPTACANGTVRESGQTDLRFVVLTIKDQGPGIPPEEMKHLFDPFRSTKACGTGLGLALSKQILDRHNAAIRFTSVVGEGTVVMIMFPTTLKNGEPHVERKDSHR